MATRSSLRNFTLSLDNAFDFYELPEGLSDAVLHQLLASALFRGHFILVITYLFLTNNKLPDK